MSKFLTGQPVSSHVSLTLITVTPSLSSSSTSWRLPTIDRPNLSSAHTMSTWKRPRLASLSMASYFGLCLTALACSS